MYVTNFRFADEADSCEQEIHIIEQSLNKTPIPLDKELWRIMKHYNLCRKPSEELTIQFTFAKAVPIPDTVFAQHVNRMLKSLLQATLKVSELIFVEGKESTIDVHFDGAIWRIHRRWLTSGGAHAVSSCEEEQKDGMFCCDHVIYHLWELMVAHHGALGLHSRADGTDSTLKNMARLRLSQTPRAVTCQPNDKRGQLHVTWSSVDSYQHRDLRVKIVLHDDSCARWQTMAMRGRTRSQTTKQPSLHPLDILLNMGEEGTSSSFNLFRWYLMNRRCPLQLSHLALTSRERRGNVYRTGSKSHVLCECLTRHRFCVYCSATQANQAS